MRIKIILFDQESWFKNNLDSRCPATKKRTNAVSRPALGLITRHAINLIKLQLGSLSLRIDFPTKNQTDLFKKIIIRVIESFLFFRVFKEITWEKIKLSIETRKKIILGVASGNFLNIGLLKILISCVVLTLYFFQEN